MGTKISEMTAASTLAGTETIELVQSGTNKKVGLNTAVADLNVVQQNTTTGDLEIGGTPIVITDMVETWAELQAIPKIAGNDGISILCKEVGVGAGSVWIYQHSTTKWYPQNGSVVMGRFFNVAKTGLVTDKQLFATVYFPTSAGVCCFGDNDTVHILESYAKTGIVGGITKGWMVGSTGTLGGDVDLDFAVAATTNTNIGGRVILQRSGNTSVKKLWSGGPDTLIGYTSTARVTPATVPSINSNGLYISSALNLANVADSIVYEFGEFVLTAGV